MPDIILKSITKSFGKTLVLSELDATIKDGEFVTLLGPSGCGKTTTLRMIAGFERPTGGEIYIGDELMSGKDVFVPTEDRNIGMVFQSYAVWPHMNVFDNVAYPLKIRNRSKDMIKEAVLGVLEDVGLSGSEDKMPSQLSGGQQQRVALGRALVSEAKILLCDEPLSNLDTRLRKKMRTLIKDVQKKYGMTIVYVTHDLTEALDMSDKIYVLNEGIIQQVGSPKEISESPANDFVKDFISDY